MTNVLILGANGQLARNTIPFFLDQEDVRLTLFLRRPKRLRNPDPARVNIVEGDVLDATGLRAAMQGQDVVYANLVGPMAQQARNIIDAMHATGLQRLIFISSSFEGLLKSLSPHLNPSDCSGSGSKLLSDTFCNCFTYAT